MLETNNISFIALSLMLLSFFYYVYSINIKKNLMKFIENEEKKKEQN